MLSLYVYKKKILIQSKVRKAGGRATTALNRLGLLSSKSPIYRSLQKNYTKVFFSANCDIEDVLTPNLNRILHNVDDGLFSLKLDGIAIKDVVRWCSYNNEFVGLCHNHKSN